MYKMFKFRGPSEPTMVTCLESKLESLIIHFHVKTVEKPLFIFCVVSGMTVFTFTD